MPLWSVEEWRVRIACSYSALGIWRPFKLRGYGGRIKGRRQFVSRHSGKLYLSSIFLLSSVSLFLLCLLVANTLIHSLGRWNSYGFVYPKTRSLIIMFVFLLNSVMLPFSYFMFQLLLSGDIETNPGPSQLTISDLHSVRSTVQPASSHWYEIGLALKVNRSQLDKIELDGTRNQDDCFTAVLSAWLKANLPPPTWSMLLNALRHPLVDCGWLATLIEDEHTLEKSTAEGYHPTLTKPFREVLPLASDWFFLGILLDIPESKLSAIRKNNHDRRDRLREILLQWLKQTDPTQLWYELAEAVEPLNPVKAQEIRQKYSVTEERYLEGGQLTLIRAFRVSYCLASEWYYLGVFLGVSESALSSIDKNNCDYHDCMREMLAVWLKESDHVSWTDLAEAVELLDPQQAQIIRRRYMGEDAHDDDLQLGLSSAFRELFDMSSQWYYIGVLLNIPKSDLSMVRSKSFDRRCRCREMLNVWLKQKNPLPTWIELADAVEPLDPAKAEEIRLRCCVEEDQQKEDDHLTLVKSLRIVFSLSREWYSIGMLLKIPESYLHHIKASNLDSLECLSELLKEWLKQPNATWNQLSEVVEQIQPDTAQVIQKKYCLKQSQKDKSEILDDALKQGCVLLHITKVVISGSAGTGKTHTKYVLFDEQDKSSQIRRSTPLFDDPIRALSRQIVGTDKTGCEWFKVTYHELNQMLARSIEDGVHFSETVHKENTQVYITSPEQSRPKLSGTEEQQDRLLSQQLFKRQTSASTSINFSNLPQAVSSENSADCSQLPVDLTKTSLGSFFTDNVDLHKQMYTDTSSSEPYLSTSRYCSSASRKELLHIMRSRTRSKPLHLHWIHFIDSGGQPQFHELLQIFIRNTSVVMIVLKLSESLDSYPEIAYYDRQTGQLCGKTYISNIRNDQIIQRCIRTLSRDKHSRVLVVGTHLDHAHESRESIEEKNNKLSKILGPTLGNKLIMKSPQEVAFPLNALTPGEHDRRVADQIRCEIAKDKHLSDPYKVPIAWFLLEQDMQKLDSGVVSLQNCYELGRTLQMTKLTVDAALEYFHELNIALYYPSILPNVVFVSPQVVVDKVTELIEYSYYLQSRPESAMMESEEKWKQFIECGEISIQILNIPKFSKHYVEELFSPNELLLVLQNLFIVAPLSPFSYFMPSVLPEIVAEELDEYRLKTPIIPPVILHFKDGCVPNGVFCCLSVYLITNCKWKRAQVMYRNCMKFLHGDNDNHIVTIVDAFEHIEVYLQTNTTDNLQAVCQNILASIEFGVQESSIALQQHDIGYTLAIQCPCTSSGEKQSVHAAVVNINEWRWTCTNNKRNVGHVVKDFKVWFHKEITKNKSTQTETVVFSSSSVEIGKVSGGQKFAEELELKSSITDLEMKIQKLNLSQEHPVSQERDSYADSTATDGTVARRKQPAISYEHLTSKPMQNTDSIHLDLSCKEKQLRGAQVCATTSLVVTKSAKYFEWKGFGFRLHITEDSLPHDLDRCVIYIRISIAGQYNFPENHYLVSAVYWLHCEPNCTFTKTVSIEIQHCSPQKHFAKLCFVRTCSTQTLPYKFRQIGGTFSQYCSYGTKELHGFSGYSVVQEGSSTKKYVGKVYYSEKTISSLRIHFALIWNTDVHLNIVDKYYKSEKNATQGPDVQLCFESDAISLDIPHEGTMVCDGWKLEPLTNPKVTKEEADSFEVSDTGHNRIPACQLQAVYETDGDGCPPRLCYTVKILGASTDQFFRINEDFSAVSTQPDREPERKRKRAFYFISTSSSHLAPEQKRKKIIKSNVKKFSKSRKTTKGLSCEYDREVPCCIRTCDKPTLQQLQILTNGEKSVRVIGSVAYRWEQLAIALELKPEIIACLLQKQDKIQNVECACTEAFTKWLNNEGKPISWNTLIQSLIAAEFAEVAQDIQEILQKV